MIDLCEYALFDDYVLVCYKTWLNEKLNEIQYGAVHCTDREAMLVIQHVAHFAIRFDSRPRD